MHKSYMENATVTMCNGSHYQNAAIQYKCKYNGSKLYMILFIVNIYKLITRHSLSQQTNMKERHSKYLHI